MKWESIFGQLIALLLLGGVLVTPVSAAGAEATPAGRWLTASGNLEVEIAPCGQALCGTVVRVVSNRSMSNPAVEMKDAPSALGMKILSDFAPAGDGEWKGRIYNRENGKTYNCVMSLAAPDQLKLRPYVGITLFGKNQVWQRLADTSGAK